jgi:hypothetical protein
MSLTNHMLMKLWQNNLAKMTEKWISGFLKVYHEIEDHKMHGKLRADLVNEREIPWKRCV